VVFQNFALWTSIADNCRISIAGLVVLGGNTRVADPNINWRDAWKGTSSATAYGATNAMVKIVFSYAGYTNAFGLVNEMKVSKYYRSAWKISKSPLTLNRIQPKPFVGAHRLL
jgi:hypothetical protein